jgi:hypothetical protein
MSAKKEFTYVHYERLLVARDKLCRDDIGDLTALKALLLSQGWTSPLGVRAVDKSQYCIISGLGVRRWHAVQAIIDEGGDLKPLEWVPVHVHPDGNEVDNAILLLASDTQRPLREELKAQAVKVLIESKLPASQIASTVGIAAPYVRQMAEAAAGRIQYVELKSPFAYEKVRLSSARKVESLLAFAKRLPEPSRDRIAPILTPVLEYLDEMISAEEALARIAHPDSVPAE